ncbi:hypothetical protein OAJ55_03560 [Candidatus Nitrosopelagicus sp.]|nr:hypothetical protein [Candidatus Nitrosopelagicus sp.]
MVKSSAFVIYILPIVLSVSLGTAVMAETLNSSDRELNFLQFGGEAYIRTTDEISFDGFNSEIAQNSNLEFGLKVSNPDYDCGDLYITIYEISTSEKQIFTQSGYLKQCFIQNNNTLPVGESYSELISKPGSYEIHIEIFNDKYSDSISVTKTLLVK